MTLNLPPSAGRNLSTSEEDRDVGRCVIEILDVRLQRGGVDVLVIDELRMSAGVTALVGPNGSGKSSLLHAIARVLSTRSGTIRVDGEVAYVLQTQHAAEHLLVTAGEVVALGRAVQRGAFGRLRTSDRNIIAAAMDRVEVRDLAQRHLAEMSGGQRQRVFVAQGLAQQAGILLLDEPMAGLDLVSIQQIRKIIGEERDAGRTVVVATHDLAEAAAADHVVLINGRVIASGPPADVLTSEHLRAAYGGRVLDLGDDLIAIDDGVHRDDHEHHHHDH